MDSIICSVGHCEIHVPIRPGAAPSSHSRAPAHPSPSIKQQLIQNASGAGIRRVPDWLSFISSFQMFPHLLLLSVPGKGLCSKERAGSPKMMDLCVGNAHCAQTSHKTIKPPCPGGAKCPQNHISAVEMLADCFPHCLALRIFLEDGKLEWIC